VILPPLELNKHEPVPPADLALGERITDMAHEELGYPVLRDVADFRTPGQPPRMGTAKDFFYGQRGIFSLVIEVWDVFTEAGIEKDWFFPLRYLPEEDNLKLLQWNDEVLGGEGFMEWTPFEHPQLGKVEIGGWKRMYTFSNPPAGPLLEDICKRALAFTLRHAGSLSELFIEKVEVVELDADCSRIRAVVGNRGFMSTNGTKRALDVGTVAPPTVSLKIGEEVELVQGRGTVELGQLAGRIDRPSAYSRFRSWSQSSASAEWVVRKAKSRACSVTVLADSRCSGRDEKRVEL